MLKIGCCGFPVSKKRYYREFGVVEIQQTFYQPPEVSLAEKWRREAPEGFEFTLKAWQLITHDPKSPTYKRLKQKIPEDEKRNYGSFKCTDEVMSAWEKTKEIARALEARIIVFQCPPGFEPTDENKKNLQSFFSSIERDGYIFAWEPRGRWVREDIEPICKDLDLVHVVDPFKSSPLYGKIAYYRLHGIGGYRYRYTKGDLERLKGFIKKGKDCYFMFNNVYMFDDALEFKKLIGDSGITLRQQALGRR